MKLLLDTNFLLIPSTLKIDIFSQFKEIDPRVNFYVLDRSLKELEYIKAKGSGKEKGAASIAEQFIIRFNIEIIHTEESFKNVDQVLVDRAEKGGFSVATQDKELQEQLRKAGIKVFRLRQKKYIQLI